MNSFYKSSRVTGKEIPRRQNDFKDMGQVIENKWMDRKISIEVDSKFTLSFSFSLRRRSIKIVSLTEKFKTLSILSWLQVPHCSGCFHKFLLPFPMISSTSEIANYSLILRHQETDVIYIHHMASYSSVYIRNAHEWRVEGNEFMN